VILTVSTRYLVPCFASLRLWLSITIFSATGLAAFLPEILLPDKRYSLKFF